MPNSFYTMTIAGLERKLPLFKVADDLSIAAFILFGDVAITKAAAAELLKRAPEYDVMITAEAKSIPLIYEMAAQAGQNDYIIARKAVKVYMENVLSVPVKSITTANPQMLYLDGEEAAAMKGKRVLIVDDVISTGESLQALERLVTAAGGEIAGRMAVLAEGDAKDRDDIIFLEPLPLFHGDGSVIE